MLGGAGCQSGWGSTLDGRRGFWRADALSCLAELGGRAPEWAQLGRDWPRPSGRRWKSSRMRLISWRWESTHSIRGGHWGDQESTTVDGLIRELADEGRCSVRDRIPSGSGLGCGCGGRRLQVRR